jgi:hypothetical protein
VAGLYGSAGLFPGYSMSPKNNPAKLNPLQLRTLTLLQAIARIPGAASVMPGGNVAITRFPDAHGDHFHLGDAMVAAKNATGLYNQSVWNALGRKGLAHCEWPHQIALTPAGLGYETGLAEEILRQGGGH